jgi:hypothetical protein
MATNKDFKVKNGLFVQEGILKGYATALVVGQASAANQFVDAGPGANIGQVRYTDTATASPNLLIGRARGTTLGSFTTVQSGDRLATILITGADGTAFTQAASLLFEVDGAVATGQVPGRLMFSTASSTGVMSERMRITSGGDVGIGQSPVAYGSGYVNLALGTATGGGIFDSYYAGTRAISMFSTVAEGRLDVFGASRPLNVYVNGSQRMTIDVAGNVGIGGGPSFKFDVQNTANSATVARVYNGITGSSGSTVVVCQTDGATTNLFANSSGNVAGGVAALSGIQVTTNTPFGIWTNNAERIRITAAGDVGIGTSSPTSKLHVAATNAIISAVGTTGWSGFAGSTSSGSATLAVDDAVTFGGAAGDAVLAFASAKSLFFRGGTNERMRLDSSGNLGIGTNVPVFRLDVSTAASSVAKFTSSGASSAIIRFGDSTAETGYVGSGSSLASGLARTDFGLTSVGALVFGSNNSEKMRLDSAGNLGIGSTPVAGYGKTLLLSQGAGTAHPIILHQAINTDDERFYLLNNATPPAGGFTGTFTYNKTACHATSYRQLGGRHTWASAPTSTAGAAVSFTETMELDASGNLGIGTSSPGYKLDVSSTSQNNPVVRIIKANSGTANEHGGALIIANQGPANIARATGTYGGRIEFQYSQPTSQAMQVGASIYSAADGTQSGTGTAAFLGFCTSDATGGGANNERMRITSTGDVGIGGFPSRKFTVQGDAGIGVLPTAGDGITTLSAASTGITVLDCYHGGQPGQFVVRTNPAAGSGTSEKLRVTGTGVVQPGVDNTQTLGAPTVRWSTVHAIGIADGTTSVGALVGSTSTTAQYAAGTSWATAAFYTGGTERMRLDSSGNLLMGKTSSGGGSVGVELAGSIGQVVATRSGGDAGYFNRLASDGNIITFNRQSVLVGSISVTTSATAYNTTSDARLKKNIVAAPSAAEKIKAMQVRSFDWKADDSHVEHGFIAQELVTVEPLAVTEGDVWQIDPSKLVATLTKALQEALARIEVLEAKLA